MAHESAINREDHHVVIHEIMMALGGSRNTHDQLPEYVSGLVCPEARVSYQAPAIAYEWGGVSTAVAWEPANRSSLGVHAAGGRLRTGEGRTTPRRSRRRQTGWRLCRHHRCHILNQVLRKLNLALIGGQEKEHKQYVAQGVDLTGAMNSAMQEQAY
jgi:hypothetical protein